MGELVIANMAIEITVGLAVMATVAVLVVLALVLSSRPPKGD